MSIHGWSDSIYQWFYRMIFVYVYVLIVILLDSVTGSVTIISYYKTKIQAVENLINDLSNQKLELFITKIN